MVYAITEKNKVEGISDKPKKRSRTCEDGGEKPSSKRDMCMRKTLEVEEIVDKLKRKHGNALSLERYNAWAHMIHTGQYSSYDDPPNYPYFRMPGSKVPESSSQVKSTQCQVMSPLSLIHI